ncbi:MAG: heme o synthase [Chloroherpetonaceae bacterium]|nr:heme o synthase [Chloroherpetonaceae bacterium]
MQLEFAKELQEVTTEKGREPFFIEPKKRVAFAQIAKNYLLLTKPTIMILVVFSGAVALFLEGSILTEPIKCIAILLAVYLTGGSANALNQYFERDIDAKMSRTQNRRPLPQGLIAPNSALVFIISIGSVGILIFGVFFNWLSAFITLSTILFYGLFYTLYLKPNTPQNIVIGGAAGAMAPIGVWAAITGQVGVEAVLLFLIVFLWTPPHFWALALYCKDDYIKAGLPMLPVVKGDRETLKQMIYYTVILFIITIALAIVHQGFFFWASSVILGLIFIKKTIGGLKNTSVPYLRSLFGFSIIYLFSLFIALIADKLTQNLLRQISNNF